VQLLLQLHHEMRGGDADGDRADAIRDQMDQAWYAMTEDVQLLVRGLSSDLYTVGVARSTNGASAQLESIDLKSAVDAGDWQRLLALVRDHESLLAPAAVAYARGIAWMQLGFAAVALEFLREMIRLEEPRPQQPIRGIFSSVIFAGPGTVSKVAANT